jgi:hypothetical protein
MQNIHNLQDLNNRSKCFSLSVLSSLKGTDSQWIVDLLNAFNAGNVHLFKSLKPQ